MIVFWCWWALDVWRQGWAGLRCFVALLNFLGVLGEAI